jgi:hypothetical protein
VGENGLLASVVGLAGQQHVHGEDAAIELLDEADRLLRGKLKGIEQRGDLGEDSLQSGERLALLDVNLTRAPLPLVVGLAVSAVTVAIAVAIAPPVVAAVSLAHACFLSLSMR